MAIIAVAETRAPLLELERGDTSCDSMVTKFALSRLAFPNVSAEPTYEI
jgi:hypothetical protein